MHLDGKTQESGSKFFVFSVRNLDYEKYNMLSNAQMILLSFALALVLALFFCCEKFILQSRYIKCIKYQMLVLKVSYRYVFWCWVFLFLLQEIFDGSVGRVQNATHWFPQLHTIIYECRICEKISESTLKWGIQLTKNTLLEHFVLSKNIVRSVSLLHFWGQWSSLLAF